MMSNKTSRMRDQRGSVLFLSLLVTMALMVLGIGYVGNQNADFRLSGRSYNWIQAENIAEAGIELAMWEVNSNGALFDAADGWTGTGVAGDPFVRSGQLITEGSTVLGDYTVSLVGDGISFTAISQGFFPSQAGALSQRQVTVQMRRLPLFQHAVAGMSGITANNRLDMYGTDVSLSTNATITLGPNSDIDGDAFIGPGGDPTTDISLGPGGSISGETGALQRSIDPEPLAMPAGFTPDADISVPDNTGHVIVSAGDFEIENITVGNKGILEITGTTRILVTESFSMNNHSELIIRSGASLVLYCDYPGVVDFSALSVINNENGDPLSFIIYASDQVTEVKLGSQIDFSGAIYAPNSLVRMLNNGDFTGAVFGGEVRFGPAMTFNYDVNLRDSGPLEEFFTVQTWHSVDPTT